MIVIYYDSDNAKIDNCKMSEPNLNGSYKYPFVPRRNLKEAAEAEINKILAEQGDLHEHIVAIGGARRSLNSGLWKFIFLTAFRGILYPFTQELCIVAVTEERLIVLDLNKFTFTVVRHRIYALNEVHLERYRKGLLSDVMILRVPKTSHILPDELGNTKPKMILRFPRLTRWNDKTERIAQAIQDAQPYMAGGDIAPKPLVPSRLGSAKASLVWALIGLALSWNIVLSIVPIVLAIVLGYRGRWAAGRAKLARLGIALGLAGFIISCGLMAVLYS